MFACQNYTHAWNPVYGYDFDRMIYIKAINKTMRYQKEKKNKKTADNRRTTKQIIINIYQYKKIILIIMNMMIFNQSKKEKMERME